MCSYSEKMMLSSYCFSILIFTLIFSYNLSPKIVSASQQSDVVGKWAETIGEELWNLATRMTKSDEITRKYKEYNAKVESKNGSALITSIVKNVGLMLQQKIDAVQCIQEKAENVFENFEFNETAALMEYQYYSSKYSSYKGIRPVNISAYASLNESYFMYLDMDLNQDTHFYNLFVNINYSSVHVPSNIWDRNIEVLKAIMWSEKLDEVFQNNYKSDPALSWQYFGSDTGILRHYPALQWEVDENVADTYDCRKRSWYIETATCSKDIVILLDNSGSMHGFRYHIAKFTISSILDTFSNNDFFTILKYSKDVYDVVDCFHDVLVQATPENIKIFEDALENNGTMEGHADLPKAYTAAFELLKKYYVQRRCNESSTGCNQAIMLVTDGVAGNTTDIFEKYNWDIGDNSTKLRVRVFTYLLGKEVTKVREIQWMACLNRGYYSHVQTLDEVHEEVLKYVDVIATPLVLQNEEHPPTWTHVFTDKTYGESSEHDELDKTPRLMIAVGVPAFDRTYKEEQRNNDTKKRARLLGVAGTDIPVEDIDKLALPYKLGVNGYAFVISNNGYMILHPDLRPRVIPVPFAKERSDPVDYLNYNSIDLTEVEQIQSQDEPREPEDTLIELRRSMVMHETGSITNVPVKFHYDKMRRVSLENQDYFYAPLNNTPFSLALVLPSEYGKAWIKVGNEVNINKVNGINIAHYFMGDNWKVHPKWVYCKYHYLEDHEFDTPEMELLHFLKKLVDSTEEDNEVGTGDPKIKWKWSEQYETETKTKTTDSDKCGKKTHGDDDYYCNKELIQLLIFDAKVTNTSYGTWRFRDKYERELISNYNATLRFVATQSGLTRWQFIFGEPKRQESKKDNEKKPSNIEYKEFGDYHTTAIDETWYISAILQHAIDPISFVYSVPHYNEESESPDLQVTASHAIFARDAAKEAPGCVVGFQFSHELFYKRFINITSVHHCNDCMETCASDIMSCYVVDNNGYILISSQNNNLTGTFFGEAEGDIMEKLIEEKLFKVVPVYDTQAMCWTIDETPSLGYRFYQGIKLFSLITNWIMTEIIWFLSRLQLWVEASFYDDPDENPSDTLSRKDPIIIIPPEEIPKIDVPNYVAEECDTVSNLVILQQHSFMNGDNRLKNEIKTDCNRPFYIKRIPRSNLILVVVNNLHRRCDEVVVTASPQRIDYGNLTWPCHKLNLSFYERRRLEECFTEHEDEAKYTYCGDATSIQLKLITAIMSAITFYGFSRIFFV